MLKELHISNYVLIKELSFLPNRGFSTITGETGAGKSILIGALGLIVGKRAEPKLIQNPEIKCVVEGHFGLEKLKLESYFAANDLDFDPYTIIRREILPNGRSRAFINDTPVSLQTLREMGDLLVDIHSQNENQSLKDNAFMFDWLDAMAEVITDRRDYTKAFEKLRNTEQHLQVLVEAQKKGESERDYWQFLFEELLEADLKESEMGELESKLDFLANAESIKESCIDAYNSLEGQEGNLIDQLNSIISAWPTQIRSNPDIESFIKRVQSGVLDLKDLASDIRNLADAPAGDAEQLALVEERIALLHNLLRKHQVDTSEDLIALRDDLDNKLQHVDDRQKEIAELQNAIVILELATKKKAKALHSDRTSAQKSIVDRLNIDLQALGLPNSHVELKLDKKTDLDRFGLTNFKLMFTANKGKQLEEVQKVASGGETSRLMLVIKSHLARYKQLPTIIFDEIDTGVSGEVARKMAEMMHKLSTDLQVIAITHLPQIASRGDNHFFVHKSSDEDSTSTGLRILEGEDRVTEIAKMLSGDNPSTAALDNARDLLQNR